MKLKKKPCEGFTLRKHILFAHMFVFFEKKKSALRSLKFLLRNNKKQTPAWKKNRLYPHQRYFTDFLQPAMSMIIWFYQLS